ncbi:MAG: type II toxin-antitoxin system HipA family toxin [Thermodesulfobacteriota bacterium]|nr:type II toxin-antitoxin system HipA family toxin [Thermodesulfobacteriota bacterium]
MIRLGVWLTLFDGSQVPVGELVTSAPQENGALHGQFRYDINYLNSPHSFSLDPFHLPLCNDIFDANRPFAGVHGVFEDSLPDDWGRRLLIRRYKLPRQKQRVPNLLQARGSDGLGALSFAVNAPPPKQSEVPAHKLEKLLQLSEEFEKDPSTVDDDLTLLFEAGSSPGGARPKVVVNYKGKSWLAKLPSIRDQFDVIGLETGAMRLSSLANIDTAHTELIACGPKRVLLIERFDITPTGGRRHMVSMQTLTGADGYYHLGYRDMAEIIRRISAQPGNDLERLFRQMVFNALIGNTDDHLKNFCMLYGEHGWSLSPAFDLLPNIGLNHEHQLHIAGGFRPPNRNSLIQEAKSFGIKRQQRAEKIINEVVDVVSTWKVVFQQIHIPDADIKILGKDISNRLTSAGFGGE